MRARRSSLFVRISPRNGENRHLASAYPSWLLASAVVLGGIGAVSPLGLLVVLSGLGIGLAGVLLLLYPHTALSFSFFLIILADTKFRTRDARSLLSGHIDAQVIFELCLYGIIGAIVLARLLALPLRRLKPTSIECVLGVYVGLALLSAVWSADFQITAVRGAQLFIIYLVCFVSVRVLGPQESLRCLVLWVVSYVSIAASLAVIFPWANGTKLTHVFDIPRFSWFAVHPILAGTYAATAALFLLAAALFSPKSSRRLLGLPVWLYVVPLAAIVLATRSRGPLIAFVGAAVILGMRKYINPWCVGFAGYVTLASLLVFLSLGVGFSDALTPFLHVDTPLIGFVVRGQTADEFLAMSGRLELWQGAYALFSERPIFGYGYVASRNVLLEVLPWAGHAHNALLETLLDLGIIGTLLVWFVLSRTVVVLLLSPVETSNPTAWYGSALLGVLFFLTFNSVIDATFAGAPGYQVFLLFMAALTADKRQWGVPALSGPDDPRSSWLSYPPVRDYQTEAGG